MADFATTADLAGYLGRASFSATEDARAEALLVAATELIRSEGGAWIAPAQTDVTQVIWGHLDFGALLPLPERFDLAVTEIKEDGTVLDAATYELRKNEVWRKSAWWGGPEVKYEVKYSYGLAAVPKVIETLCLAVAARAYGLPPGGGVRTERLGGWSATYDASNGEVVWLAPTEANMLRRFTGKTRNATIYIGSGASVATGQKATP